MTRTCIHNCPLKSCVLPTWSRIGESGFVRLLSKHVLYVSMDEARILSNAIASLEMEDLHPSEFDKELATRLLRREITIDSAMDILINRYRVES